MKKCCVCKIEKSLDEYHNMKRAKDGKRSQCKSCHLKSAKEYRTKNIEQCQQRNKKYYKQNQNEICQKYRDNYVNNPQKYLDKNKKWVFKNKDKVNEYRKQWQKDKWRNDIDYRIKCLLRGRLYKALTKGTKYTSVIELLGCSIDELKIYLSSKFTEGMTWDNYGKWHIDHIKPCISFDLTKKLEQQKCFHYSNLQPLWAKDNLVKSTRLNCPNE